jgi:glutamate-ammonia-ligase adenylyltransferase
VSDRGPRRMRAELRALRGGDESFDPRFVALRRLHRRELLRLALREVAAVVSPSDTTRELSALADVCLQEVLTGWQADCGRRWNGAPETGFAVLGLGKLGGRDLNFSSDVDLMFLYGEDGPFRGNFSNHEYFTRLGEKFIGTFTANEPAGPLFRVDFRLRPEGKDGPLVTSLNNAENYYAGHGETWERLALIKARGVAGDMEVAYEFCQRLQPFVFPRSVAPDMLDEIGDLKARIEQEIHCADIAAPGGNVKLGPGGIREIEFIAGALQLLHGAKHAFLQESNTTGVLAALARLQFLPTEEFKSLAEAYAFLRLVEHRLQIENEAQTHSLPNDPAALLRLARSLRFADADALFAALRARATLVRTIFERVLGSGSRDGAAPRNLAFFSDVTSAQKNLRDLSAGPTGVHAAPRTRRLFARLEPLLLGHLSDAADPDGALRRFVRFVESYGIRGLLLETLVTHPRLLDLLLRVFDASEYFSSLLIRRPAWIEELVRGASLDDALTTADHLEVLRSGAPDIAALRLHQQGSMLRILMRDVLALNKPGGSWPEVSAIAEASLIHAHELLGLGQQLTIIGYGKFGGRELGYGADVDAVLIGEDPAPAEALSRALAQSVAEGGLFPLDTRLRPEGVNGPLVSSLGNLEHYFTSGRAQVWEGQALTKARAICGPLTHEFTSIAEVLWRNVGRRPDLFEQIAAMLQRVQRERGSAEVDGPHFKTGAGGLVAAEFTTQALQLRHGVPEPNTLRALEQLRDGNWLAANDHDALAEGYRFLREMEACLRRAENKAVSSLPTAEVDLRRLGRRLGFAGAEDFQAAHRQARTSIARIAKQILG